MRQLEDSLCFLLVFFQVHLFEDKSFLQELDGVLNSDIDGLLFRFDEGETPKFTVVVGQLRREDFPEVSVVVQGGVGEAS